jgi:subtilisin family serine protease
MRYVVLRRPVVAENDDRYIEAYRGGLETFSRGGNSRGIEWAEVGRGGEGDNSAAEPASRPVAETHNHLSDDDVREMRQKGEVVEPALPLSLIEPVSTGETKEADIAWGIPAVGVDSDRDGGRGVTIAVLDTGIDSDHPAFAHMAGRMSLSDFTENERGVEGTATDTNGHGTHVAGTIFGRLDKGPRIGVAPGIERVLIGKVIGAGGSAPGMVYNAIDWAVENGADIISMSLGINFRKAVEFYMAEDNLPEDIAETRALEGYRDSLGIFETMAELIERRSGALLIAASGNASRRDVNLAHTVAAGLPATVKGFISVGALRETGLKQPRYSVADFSNTGCALSAPGEGILSARLGGRGDKALCTKSGTSMATPHVAGVAALWLERLYGNKRPRTWTGDVRRELETGVVKLDGASRADVGLGMVQAPR